METRKVSEINFRDDLYPRIDADPATIQKYADNLDMMPPIEVNQHNEIIDGFHRWTAHRKLELEDIDVNVTPTKSDADLYELAIKRNRAHGLQMSAKDKRDAAQRLYLASTNKGPERKKEIGKLLSVGKSSLYEWLKDIDKAEREKRNTAIKNMWLACYSRDEIAKALDIGESTVSGVSSKIPELEKPTKVKAGYMEDDWKTPHFNVWKFAKVSNELNHFGKSEQTILDYLLYLYTEPFDIVLDPFAGGGATIDVCRHRSRRYWISDRKPIVERENDIRAHDIVVDGLPPLNKRWSEVTLTYLDPPYWRQAEGMYSEDKTDLANMPLDEFTSTTANLIKDIASKQSSGAVAMLMQPTQWNADNREYTDHVFDIVQAVGLKVANRVSCPYSTQQANPQMVDWAKENKQLLVISRELVIWEVG